ncbi:MAG: hypothetical protein CVV23_14910 [Ignavibacteriae bacterium HGW-Ignavibacteriae-2]|nr:MAG: hypothetical protein CVV23_14910 [Ignavibacteriae bacterium HGW-Ignavibacteriae-2]
MRILIILLILSMNMFAQMRNNSFFWEINQFPEDSSSILHITYRITYESLVFVKDKNMYNSGLNFFVETFKNGNVTGRISDSKNVSIYDYSLTNSANHYVEGMVSIRIPFGEAKIYADVELINSDKKIKIPTKELIIASRDTSKILNPIVIKDIKSEDGLYKYLLCNYSGTIPYSDKSYSVLIPIMKTSVPELTFKIKQQNDSSFTVIGEKVISGIPDFKIENKSILIRQGDISDTTFSFYLINNFSNKLNEGRITIEVKDEPNIKHGFLDVLWVHKPLSLSDNERAIRILRNIEKEKELNKLLSVDKEKYYEELKKYWSKYDPDESTPYNEVMNEFYCRVDTADLEFGSLDIDNGSESDRGKIYIKFGRPEKIERTYSESNQTLEFWYYGGSINRKFVFEDKAGLGNYILIN